METVTFYDVVAGAADLAGVSPDPAAAGGGGFGDLLTEDVGPLTRVMDRLLREGWEFYPWPDLVDVTRAAYRRLWSAAAAYATGDEVYFDVVAGEEGYFRAVAATAAGESPVTHPAKWTVLVLGRLVIDPGVWGIGTVLDVWAQDLRETDSERAARVPFVLRSDGIQVSGSAAGAVVWVEHKRAAPRLRGAAYDATAAYAAGEAVLFANEDFWVCVAATTAGESPVTHAAKWAVQAVPVIFRDFLIKRAWAFWLRRSGAPEEALPADADGWMSLYQEIDRIAGQSGQVQRYRVTNTR